MSDLPPPPPPNMAPPPGYVQYGGYGAVQGRFQRIGALTKWLVALLAISLAVQAISFLVQFTLRDSAADFLDETITSGQFDDKVALYLGVAFLAAIAGIAQLVILIIWTFRMAKNHLLLGRQPQSFGAGATIAVNILGGCTLGILNFFMWREMWRASDPETAPGDPSWKQRAVTPLLAIYLGTSLASIVAAFGTGFSGGFGPIRTTGSSDDLAENLNDDLLFVLLSGALTLVAAAVFLVFVRQLAARHMAATRESTG